MAAAASRFTVAAVFKGVDKVSAPVTRMQSRMSRFTRSARRGLRSVGRALTRVTRGLAAGAGKLAKYGLAMGAIAAFAVVRAVNSLADAADDLAKRSRRLEFPIEELQEWQFVAEQSGLSTEEFDKNLEKFTKGVGEAKAGTGTLVTMLKKANPELLKQVTNAGSVAEAYEIYMQALRDTDNVMTRTALSTAAFGRSGGKMLNIVEQSSDAIKKLRLEQRENGIITKEQAMLAEQYNDAVNSLKKSLGGLLQKVFFPMFPALIKLVKGWREWIIANKALIASKIFEFLSKARDKLRELWAQLVEFNKANDIGAMLEQLFYNVADAIAFVAKHGKTIAIIIGSVYALTTAVTLLNLAFAVSPIGWIVIGLVAAAAAGVALVTWIDEIVAGFERLPAVFRVAFAPLYLALKAIQALKSGKLGELAFDFVQKGGELFGNFKDRLGANQDRFEANQAAGGAGSPQVMTPESRAADTIRSESIERSVLDVNFNNKPDDVGISQRSGPPIPGLPAGDSGAI